MDTPSSWAGIDRLKLTQTSQFRAGPAAVLIIKRTVAQTIFGPRDQCNFPAGHRGQMARRSGSRSRRIDAQVPDRVDSVDFRDKPTRSDLLAEVT